VSAPKILFIDAGENVAGGQAKGVMYFGTVYKVPCAVWKSGAFEAWILETYPPQSNEKIPGMEPVPGGSVELIEAHTPDMTGDLWVMWRVPYRQERNVAEGGAP
jgi:hypothetical protein